MAGASLEIRVDDAALRSALAQLRATTGDLQPVFRDLGEALLNSTRDRFSTFKSPSGTRWAALSPAYQKRKKQNKHKILTLRGHLRGLLAYQVRPDALLVGTPLDYGATHQFGAKKGAFGRTRRGGPIPWGDIPARPFLGLSDADRAEIDTILREHLRRAGVS